MIKPDTRLRRGTALVKLADLLSIDGWETLCREIGLEGEDKNRDNVRKDPNILLSRISHTLLFARVQEDRGPAISMVTEIMDFLAAHGMAARTTGTIATLPGLEAIKPQQRKLMTEWDRSALRRLGRNTKLQGAWEEASGVLDGLLEQMCEEHPGRWRPSRYGDFLQQRPSDTTYCEDVVDLLLEQITLIEQSLPKDTEDNFISDIRRKCRTLRASCKELTELYPPGSPAYIEPLEHADKITIFVEQLRITATLLSALDDVVGLIELSVFRNLPQLFEVWLLCFILSTLEQTGYIVTLENVAKVGQSDIWNVKYAGADSPIARIGEDRWVFFQFKAKSAPAMPDLAIYDNESASGQALIVLDAKFSEKSGYAAADYRETLEKYRNLSSCCYTVEYFDRPDIAPENGMMFGVRPDADAVTGLKGALFAALVAPTRRAMAVIDCSSSFADQLPRALTQLLLWVDSHVLKDEFIVFARLAELRKGLAGQIRKNAISLPGENGTLVESLAKQLEALRAAGEYVEILLVSDGDFQDGNLDTLRAVSGRLWTFGIA